MNQKRISELYEISQRRDTAREHKISGYFKLSLLGEVGQESALAEVFPQLHDPHSTIPYPIPYQVSSRALLWFRCQCCKGGAGGAVCSANPDVSGASKTLAPHITADTENAWPLLHFGFSSAKQSLFRRIW